MVIAALCVLVAMVISVGLPILVYCFVRSRNRLQGENGEIKSFLVIYHVHKGEAEVGLYSIMFTQHLFRM